MRKCKFCEGKAEFKCNCSEALLCSKHTRSHSSKTLHNLLPVTNILDPDKKKELESKIESRFASITKLQQEISSISAKWVEDIEKFNIDLQEKLEKIKLKYSHLLDTNIYSDEDYGYIEQIFKTKFYARQIKSSKVTTSIIDYYKQELIKELPEDATTGDFFEAEKIQVEEIDDFVIDGDNNVIWAVAFTSDSEFIVFGCEDKSIQMWGVQSRTQVGVLKGHVGEVTSLALTSNDEILVSGSGTGDCTIRLWKLHEQEQISILRGHTDIIWGICITQDNEKAISSSQDKTIRIWNLHDFSQEGLLQGHTSHVLCIAITHDDKLLVSGSYDKTVRIWNLQEKWQDSILQGHNSAVFSVAISNDNKFIATGALDKLVRVWSFESKNILFVLQAHSATVQSLAFILGDKFLISGSEDKTVKVWNLEKRKTEVNLTGHTNEVTSLTVSRNDWFVVSGSYDSSVRVWNIHKRLFPEIRNN